MAGSANNIKIVPVNVLWQIEANFTFDYAGIAAADLDAAYFTLNSAKDATAYYLWHDLDASSVDPAPGGTGIEVEVTTGDSASAMATAAAAAIDTLGDFSASADGSVVTVTNAAVGKTTAPADVDSGLLITVCRNGQDFDLGLLEGDVEKTFSPANFPIVAHQTGVTKLGLLNQGIETLEVSTTMQETQNSQLAEIYGVYGTDGFVPAAGTEVFGAGTAKVGANLLVDAARLILRPVDTSEGDVNLMLALPVPDSLVFSGENPRTLSVTWQGFPDLTKDSRVDSLLFGDASQSGL